MPRVACTPWLEHLATHLDVARVGEDPEGVHQVRVAGRRLRVWLDLGGHRVLHDDVRWLVQRLGAVRDMDVLCATPLGAGGPFARWLRTRRERAQVEARLVLDSPRVAALLEGFVALRPPEAHVALRHVEAFAAAASRRAEAWLRALEDDGPAARGEVKGLEELHRFRRALRRARYARDWVDRPSKRLARLQDVLGEVCDVGALWRLVAQWEAEAGRTAEAERALLADAAAAMMGEVRAAWPGLSGALALPEAEVVPPAPAPTPAGTAPASS